MITKNYINKLFKSIIDTGGLTDDMESSLEKIRDDFEEREGELKKYGEFKNGDDEDNYEYFGSPLETHTDDYKEKYDILKQKYRDRFWSSSSEEIDETNDTDTDKEIEENENIKIDDLFKEEK